MDWVKMVVLVIGSFVPAAGQSVTLVCDTYDQTIACPPDYVIEVLQTTAYTRSSTACDVEDLPSTCTMEIITLNSCTGKRICRISRTLVPGNWLGDGCGLSNTLHVEHRCHQFHSQENQELIFCSFFDPNLRPEISCEEEGTVIDVIEATVYKSVEQSFCRPEGFCGGSFSEFRCRGLQQCTIEHADAINSAPDCGYTDVIHVRYQCYQFHFTGYRAIKMCSFFENAVAELSCPAGEVIVINEVKAAYVPDIISCARTTIPSDATCPSLSQWISSQCHGSNYCSIRSDAIPWSECGNPHNIIMQVDYDCYAFNDLRTLYLPETNLTGDGYLNVISPGFPCNISKEYTSVECTVASSSRVWIRLFQPLDEGGVSCGDMFTVGDTVYCSAQFQQEVNLNINIPITIRYSKSPGHPGGRFWIQVRGSTTITCSSKAEGTETTTESQGSCSPFKPYPLPTTSGETGTMTSLDPGDVTHHDQSSSSSPPYGIIGGVVGFVVLVIIIVVMVLLWRKRRKRNVTKDRETTLHNTDTAANNGVGVYMEALEYGHKPNPARNQKQKQRNKAPQPEPQVYAMVDKTKKTNRAITEETIMVENDDLYEAGNVRNEGTKNGVNEVTADETIMCENDDLYEATNIKHKNNNDDYSDVMTTNNETTKDPDVKTTEVTIHHNDDDDKDSVIAYEENELYCSSGDLAEDDVKDQHGHSHGTSEPKPDILSQVPDNTDEADTQPDVHDEEDVNIELAEARNKSERRDSFA